MVYQLTKLNVKINMKKLLTILALSVCSIAFAAPEKQPAQPPQPKVKPEVKKPTKQKKATNVKKKQAQKPAPKKP